MSVSISVKSDIKEKELFDKGLKSALEEQIKKTVEAVVKKHKDDDLVYDEKSNKGWVLNVTPSLSLDDPAKPKKMDGKVQVVGINSGSTSVLKASAGGNATGLRPNNLEAKAKQLVGDILEELLTKKIIPGIVPKKKD
jgi:hypothetical protein